MLRAAQKRASHHELAGSNGSAAPYVHVEADGYAVGPERTLLERFRVLRSNVQFTQVDRPHSTMLVTSTVPQEGKSYTASNLAAAMALDGRRVILVDADLHRPRQHGVFKVPVQPGLTNVLVGQAQLKDCLHETGIEGFRVLTAGVLPPNPVELLNSPSMESVLELLKSEADLVIFDSPPVLATADAQVLASKVDGVLYVMQLGSVPKSAVARSFELLEQARANILGIALNKIGGETNFSGYYSGYYGAPEDRNGQPNRSGADEAWDDEEGVEEPKPAAHV
jgi:capsular exopolysaccharide synthesis family protein